MAETVKSDLVELRDRRLALEAELEDLRVITAAVVLAGCHAGMTRRSIGALLGLSESHVGRLVVGRRSGRQPVGGINVVEEGL